MVVVDLVMVDDLRVDGLVYVWRGVVVARRLVLQHGVVVMVMVMMVRCVTVVSVVQGLVRGCVRGQDGDVAGVGVGAARAGCWAGLREGGHEAMVVLLQREDPLGGVEGLVLVVVVVMSVCQSAGTRCTVHEAWCCRRRGARRRSRNRRRGRAAAPGPPARAR